MSFPIIRNAPPPPPHKRPPGQGRPKGKSQAYPFADMNIGDAFDVPIDPMRRDTEGRHPEYNRLSALISYRHKVATRRYVIRLMSDCVRCWRVA